MKLISKVFILLIFTTSCTQELAPISYKGHIYYTKKGEKPINIIKSKSKTKKVITKKNLKPNQILVQNGDNLYVIAKKYKITTRQLIDQNLLKPPYILQPGQILDLPSKRKTHIVLKGENLTLVARKYNISLNELAQVNNLKTNSKIKIGNVLIIPYNGKTTQKKHLVAKIFKSKIKLNKPLDGEIIKKFGPDKNGTHNDGINISAPLGTDIKAAADGKIVYVGNELRGYGNLIIIKHSGNILTAYAHSNEIIVAKNQSVKKGEKIATVGSTGNVSSPQLHFGVRQGRKAVNPISYF